MEIRPCSAGIPVLHSLRLTHEKNALWPYGCTPPGCAAIFKVRKAHLSNVTYASSSIEVAIICRNRSQFFFTVQAQRHRLLQTAVENGVDLAGHIAD